MSLIFALTLSFLPLIIGIALCLFFVKEFKILHVLATLVLGLIAIVLIILVRTVADDIETMLPPVLTGFVGVVVSTILYAFLEESVKMLVLSFLAVKINNLKNFIIACLLFGGAVGCFETMMYLVTGFTDTALRLCTAVVIHTLCAALAGFFVWSIKYKFSFVRAFLMSFLLHGVYNFFAAQTSVLWWFSIITILFTAMKCRIYYLSIKEKTESLVEPS